MSWNTVNAHGFPGLGTEIQLAEDARVIPANVEYFVTLQVQVAFHGLNKQLSRGL
jgi:hypothetical protein